MDGKICQSLIPFQTNHVIVFQHDLLNIVFLEGKFSDTLSLKQIFTIIPFKQTSKKVRRNNSQNAEVQTGCK